MSVLVGFPWLAFGEAALGDAAGRVIPRPQIEEHGRGWAPLEIKAGRLNVVFRDITPGESAACEGGLRLLGRRLRVLGGEEVTVQAARGDGPLVVNRVSAEELSRMLRRHGAREEIAGKRLEQAYTLVCRAGGRGGGTVQIAACSDLGIYYGLVSLCQLVEKNEQGKVCLPEVKLADWPEIGLRLAKTSASTSTLAQLREYAIWLPLYKMNVLGLQFHGTNSNEVGPFRTGVQAVCSRARQEGTLETIVYFCPFRGKGYNFSTAVDQERYAKFLQWILDQGANGIEVDYNDWPDRAVPIEDVINLACRAVAQRDPRAYVLYCPPSRGSSMYRGPASAEMTRILSVVPTRVWPLWTGSATNNALIEKPLDPAEVEAWTRAAGRRPFLWVNRVGPRDQRNRPFTRRVSEVPGAFVFRGDFLPKELNRLFEGVHFNVIPLSRSDSEMLAYLATAADYVWNPRNWEAVDSCRRAKRFVETMLALVAE